VPNGQAADYGTLSAVATSKLSAGASGANGPTCRASWVPYSAVRSLALTHCGCSAATAIQLRRPPHRHECRYPRSRPGQTRN